MSQYKIIPLEERIVLDATLSAPVLSSSMTNHSNDPYGVWPLAGHDQTNSGTSSDVLINTSNVNTLVQGWSLQTGSSFNAQPVIADGVVYAADFAGTVYAVKESSGQVLWQTKLTVNDGNGAPIRTESIYTSPTITKDTLYIASDNLYAINRQTGAIMWQAPLYTAAEKAALQSQGIDLSQVQGGQVQLAGNYLIVGRYFTTEASTTPIGFAAQDQKVLIFNSTTGALAYSIDLSNINGVQYGPGGTFSMAGVDVKDHLAFIGTGNNYSGPPSPYADSLIAIDYTTGQIAWHYQFNSGDIWNASTNAVYDTQHDLDVSTHANIFTMDVGGHLQTFVGQGAKDGTYRIFNAVQADPNHVTPVAILQFGPGSVAGTLQSTPVIHNGVLYVAVNLAFDPSTGQVGSIDNVQSVYGPLAILQLGVQQIYALDLSKVIQSGTQGTIPQTSILWTNTLGPPFLADTPNAMTYDNGVLFVSGIQGTLTALNAADGSTLTTLTPGPFISGTYNGYPLALNAPVLGGPSVDFGRVFVGTGIEGIAPGALVEYELPIMKTVDAILNSTPQQYHNLAADNPQQFAQAMSLNHVIQTANRLIDNNLWTALNAMTSHLNDELGIL